MKKQILSIAILCLTVSMTAMGQTAVPSGYADLDEWTQQCLDDHSYALGYPGNYNGNLESFYKWYTDNKLENILINNAGDPF